MTSKYTLAHAVATLIGVAALGYQTAVIWDALAHVDVTTRLGVPLATVSAALLPVLAEAAWKQGARVKATFLALPVLVLIAFVLPSGISRLGEAQQAKREAAVTSQGDATKLRADLAKADKLVAEAQAWAASECRSGKGPKCDGVVYTLNQRQAYQRELAGKLTGSKPAPTPWLPDWHPATLPIGMELALWGCFFFGFAPLLTRVPKLEAVEGTVPNRSQVAITERQDPLTDEEIEELKRIIKGAGGRIGSQKQLTRLLGVEKAEVSRRIDKAVAAGVCQRVRNGRENAIVLH